MKPKEKGDLAVAHAISYFITNGYEVCLPIGDKRKYDLIAEIDNCLFRVQVKYAGYYKGTNKHMAALRTMGGNQSYYTAKKYSVDAFDLLYVFVADGKQFLFPWKEIENRNSISVEASKFMKYEVK
ncbi:MAG: group I intron-associated PD-(D/E)XK endonuclease [Candidatus Microsaccharimonas sp.]